MFANLESCQTLLNIAHFFIRIDRETRSFAAPYTQKKRNAGGEQSSLIKSNCQPSASLVKVTLTCK